MISRILVFSLFMMMATHFPTTSSAADTVAFVDLGKYTGHWYEIMSIPQWFQKGCKNTQAEYTALSATEIKVVNSCVKVKRDGEKLTVAEGRGYVVDTETNAKLKVTFLHAFGKWIKSVAGDYWVLYLGPIGADGLYSLAIVGNGDRSSGWVLSRTKTLSPEDLMAVERELLALNYDRMKFQTTVHD